MPFLELFDETLDINSTDNYELSVQVSPYELSFCILDSLRNKFVLLRSYEPEDNSRFDPFRLNEIIKKDDFLIRHYKKTSVITPSSKSTLVPSPLFDESKTNEYFTFNQAISEGDKIMTNKLHNPDIYIIFSVSTWIEDILKAAFPGSILMHQLKPLFQFINYSKRSIASNHVQVHFEKDYLNMVIFDQNELKFCNTFHYKTIPDVQYYILYVLKKMNISQEETIFFSGKTTKREEVLNVFSNYLRVIKYALPPGNCNYSYVFNDTELHIFLNLFSAVSCG
jgi:hypothetical protein